MVGKKKKKYLYNVQNINAIPMRKMNIYEKYIKRILDIICSLLAIVCFCPIFICVAILVRIKLGSPILFVQYRPGLVDKHGRETIFKMYKFRTMTDEKDENGELLPDDVRLTTFGKWLRSTSLDELPEIFNILNGTLSICGPRPQLVRDLTFMTKNQRMRHTAKPGLSGLAQVNGRNSISWEEKLEWDLKYIQKVSFWNDVCIIAKTVKTALIKQEGITYENMATAEDLGDYLLKKGEISQEEYDKKMIEAKKILNQDFYEKKMDSKLDKIHHLPFSVIMSVYKSDNPIFFDRALNSITDSQTIVPDEIVLVVDGPVTDLINDVIHKYKNKYNIFKIIRLEKNGGLGNALKIAIENSSFELIARMDSDDISLPTRFEQQLNCFEINPKIDILGGNITEFIGKEDNIVSQRLVPVSNDSIREYMKKRCAMNHVSVMYKKSAVQNAGGYQDWFWNEDYYLWIRMWLNGAIFANTGSVLVNVRVGKEMYQRRGGAKYFESEKGLQDYMLNHGMITYYTYIKNVMIRFLIQKMMPNRMRGWVFRMFAREK